MMLRAYMRYQCATDVWIDLGFSVLAERFLVRTLLCLLIAYLLTLQRHLMALLKFSPVESRFCSCKRRGQAPFDIPIHPCARSTCSRSVAVGIGATPIN